MLYVICVERSRFHQSWLRVPYRGGCTREELPAELARKAKVNPLTISSVWLDQDGLLSRLTGLKCQELSK